jgi:hypothetical protein
MINWPDDDGNLSLREGINVIYNYIISVEMRTPIIQIDRISGLSLSALCLMSFPFFLVFIFKNILRFLLSTLFRVPHHRLIGC